MARTKAPAVAVRATLEEAGRTQRRRARSADEIAAQIQDLIITEDLARGARLPSERDLAALLGTSRPTISQAIRTLVVQGLVETRRGSGAYVLRRPQDSLASSVQLMANLDRESLPQLVELRLWLETIGADRAVALATDADLARASAALRALVAAADDVAAFMTADTEFHAAIVGAARNSYLVSLYESVHSALIEHEFRAWIADGHTPAWFTQAGASVEQLHAPIRDALEGRDAAAIERAVRIHHQEMARHIAAADAAAAAGGNAQPPAA